MHFIPYSNTMHSIMQRQLMPLLPATIRRNRYELRARKTLRGGKKRFIALMVLALMAALFLVLSALSFLDSRNQATPNTVTYNGYNAVEGRRVFQAYNCMGCHTILGNGAYFGPDLTNIYEKAGPAWLEAFLPSAGTWPTGPAMRIQLQDPAQAGATGAGNLKGYLQRFPGAAAVPVLSCPI